jgi:uncharacterized LabA/DUF88 family protein
MTERIALFIDGSNFHQTAKGLGFDVDYKRLLLEFGRRGRIVRAYYYTTIKEDGEFTSLRPLLDWLDYNGFAVRTKQAKEFDDGDGRRKTKRNMGIELAVDALELSRRIDHAFLFSGDGDLQAVVQALQRFGVRVTVVSSVRTKSTTLSDELRRQADGTIDIADLKTSIERTPSITPK